MTTARKLDPPAKPKRPTGRASTPRHLAAHRDPVGENATANVDRARGQRRKHKS